MSEVIISTLVSLGVSIIGCYSANKKLKIDLENKLKVAKEEYEGRLETMRAEYELKINQYKANILKEEKQ